MVGLEELSGFCVGWAEGAKTRIRMAIWEAVRMVKRRHIHVCVLACSVVSDSLVTPWIVAHQHLCPWDFPGKNIGVGFHFPLQGIFLTQGSNPRLLHGQVCSLPLSPQGSPQEETCIVEVFSTAGLQ